jgi:hypothetical protein
MYVCMYTKIDGGGNSRLASALSIRTRGIENRTPYGLMGKRREHKGDKSAIRARGFGRSINNNIDRQESYRHVAAGRSLGMVLEFQVSAGSALAVGPVCTSTDSTYSTSRTSPPSQFKARPFWSPVRRNLAQPVIIPCCEYRILSLIPSPACTLTNALLSSYRASFPAHQEASR